MSEYSYTYFQKIVRFKLKNNKKNLQLIQESLQEFVDNKRKLAQKYNEYFKGSGITFFSEPINCKSNYWLNAVLLKDKACRDRFLEETNDAGIMTRPVWQLMNRLPMFATCQCGDLTDAEWLEARLVNIPSSVRL